MSSFRTGAVLGTKPLVLPESGVIETVAVDINWPDAGAGVAAADVIQIAEIPAGVEVMDWRFVTDDIDASATPTVAFTLGVLNAAKTAIGAGATDAWTAAGGVNAAQTGGQNLPSGATAANCFLGGRASVRTVGLVATGATATAALAGKRASLLLFLRA